LRERRDFVRNGQIDSNEIEFAQQPQRRSQLIGTNVKPRVLHVDLARAQGGVLHLRRKRMRNGITKNPEPNRRLEVPRNTRPVLQVRKGVTVGGLLFFHSWRIENTTHARTQ
jgi:hypothetical protein